MRGSIRGRRRTTGLRSSATPRSSTACVCAKGRSAVIRHNARVLLSCERVILNLMQHLSGIATNTRRFVDAVQERPRAFSIHAKRCPA